MKNFFIAAISMAMVSSAFAQNQPQGTWYLGTTNNATDVLNIFSNGVQSMKPTIGYAVADNFVVSLSITASSQDIEIYKEDAVDYVADVIITNPLNELDTLDIIPNVPFTSEASWSDEYELRSTGLELGVQYFFGDNYFVGAGIGAGNSTLEGSIGTLVKDGPNLGDLVFEELDGDTRNTSFSLTAGKFIPVRENWYLTPQVGYRMTSSENVLTDPLMSGSLELGDVDTGDFAFSIGFGARF